MLHIVTDGLFDVLNLGRDIEQYICAVSPFTKALFFSERLVSKHLSDCYLRSFYVVQLGTAHTGNNIPARGLQEVKFE